VRCEMADPRYIGVGEEANWGDVILTEGVARKVIQLETQLPQGEAEVWMTTSQMGHSLEREETELKKNSRNGRNGAKKWQGIFAFGNGVDFAGETQYVGSTHGCWWGGCAKRGGHQPQVRA